MRVRRPGRLRSAASFVLASVTVVFGPEPARATPSSNLWAPSTHGVQGFGVLHLSYDTYFGDDGSYPIDLGLTLGVSPLDDLVAEVGFDVLYPTLSDGDGLSVPVYFNAKVGSSEDALFEHQPGWGVGVYNVGIESDVTDYSIVYGVIGKTVPYVGSVSVGGYYGLNDSLLVTAEGESAQTGLIVGYFSPAIELPVIDRMHVVWDLQTGENAFGATGAGLYFYFTPNIDLALGPVYLFEPELQPGGSRWLWTAQLDVDLDLRNRDDSR